MSRHPNIYTSVDALSDMQINVEAINIELDEHLLYWLQIKCNMSNVNNVIIITMCIHFLLCDYTQCCRLAEHVLFSVSWT